MIDHTVDDARRMTTATLPSVPHPPTPSPRSGRRGGSDRALDPTCTYDYLYRLTSVTYPGPTTTSYALDAVGNRNSMTVAGNTTTYAYDDNDRITSVTPPSPASVINYTWDDNGDLTARGSDSFSWDYEDRMVSATVNSVTTNFAYRGDGLRNSRTVGGNTTTFTWDVAAGLPVVLDDGNQYLYGAGLTAQKQSGSWYYYLADGLGSTMAVVDASGTVQDSYTYDVYGKPTKTGSLPNEFDFAGQQTDGTGLQYLRARYMDPATGTFLSRDPLASGPGWTGSGFAYAAANPGNRVDPLGLFELPGDDLGGVFNGDSVDNVCFKRDPGSLPNPDLCQRLVELANDYGMGSDMFDNVGDLANIVKDVYAFTLLNTAMALLGEYAYHRIKACAMGDECRAALDNDFLAGTFYSSEIALFLSTLKNASAVLVFVQQSWWAFKRAYSQGWTELRGKMEYQERRRKEIGMWP